MGICESINRVLCAPHKVWKKFVIDPINKGMLVECGKAVRLGENVSIIWRNCKIGNDVYIGAGAVFMCADASLTIGDHVMFGPNVTIVTGDHRTDIVGKYMSEVTAKEKLPENDLPVNLIGDNWIGANATILKGTTIGRGAIVAAGALVTKNVPPYSIVGGIPAKVIRMRFNEDEITEHERLLGLYE